MKNPKVDMKGSSRSWIEAMSEPLFGAHVSGSPAVVVDAVLARDVLTYLPAMILLQREQVESVRRQVHAAALLWHASICKRNSANAVSRNHATIQERGTHRVAGGDHARSQ